MITPKRALAWIIILLTIGVAFIIGESEKTGDRRVRGVECECDR